MFVSFLLPDVDRGAGPLYHWVMLAQMARFSPGEIIFLADEAYFNAETVPYEQELSVGGISFVCPSKERFERHRKIALETAAMAPLYERLHNHLDVFREVLTRSVPSLVLEIKRALGDLDGEPIEAFITWCNIPSLNEVARGLSVPVIHNEIGPLRGKLYVDTIYFDFLGVNGHTTPARWASAEELAAELSGVELLQAEQIRGLFVADSGRVEAVAAAQLDKTYKLGVALQVQDDSNAIAFGHGWNDLRLLYDAISHYPPEDVLVRSHPQARLTYRGGLGVADDSVDSLEFLNRVERVLSVNSSLLAEAALWEVPFQAKGDCPFACLAEDAPGGKALGQERQLWLNAFFLGYLVPSTFLFDPAYYRWRLAEKRSLGQRIQRHISAYRETTAAWPALKSPGIEPVATEMTRFSATWTQALSLETRLKIANDEIDRLTKQIEERDAQISGARNWQAEAERVWDAHEWFRVRTEATDKEQTEWRTTIGELSTAVRNTHEWFRVRTETIDKEQIEWRTTIDELHHVFAALRREKEELVTRVQMESELLSQQLEALTARLEQLYVRKLSLKERVFGRIRNTP